MNKKLIAHRGYWEVAPENTLLSFEAAHIFGFDGVEIDVHMTKDKHLVVIHDETIDRVTSGKGEISQLTLEELRKFDYGINFSIKTPFQKLLTYKDFLKEFGNKFEIINIEVKTDINEYVGIEKQIIEETNSIDHKAKIVYSSFNFDCLIRMRKESKDVELGFLFVETKELEGKEQLIKDNFNYLHPWFKTTLDEESMEILSGYNLPINIWTIDKRNNNDKWSDGSFENLDKLINNENIYLFISNSIVKI